MRGTDRAVARPCPRSWTRGDRVWGHPQSAPTRSRGLPRPDRGGRAVALLLRRDARGVFVSQEAPPRRRRRVRRRRPPARERRGCCESKAPRARSQGARACRLSHRGKVQYRGPTLLVHPGAGASPQRPPSYTLSVLPAPSGTRPQGSPTRSTARLLSSPAQGPRPGWAPPTPSTLHALAPSVVELLRLAAPPPPGGSRRG